MTADRLNVLPGYVDASDMREIKSLLSQLNIDATVFPDTSDVLDTPQTGVYKMYPKGGTKVSEIKTMGDAIATIACGEFASGPAAEKLEKKCNVPSTVLDLPIGLSNTDKFIDTLRRTANVPVPDSITLDRGRLLDLISDMSQYFMKRKWPFTGSGPRHRND